MAVLRNVGMFVLIVTAVLQCCYGFKRYHSCRDIQLDRASRTSERASQTSDGEHILYLKNNIGVSIYCHGRLYYSYSV